MSTVLNGSLPFRVRGNEGMDERKAEYTQTMTCRYCANQAPMEIVASHDQVGAYRDRQTGKEWEAGPIWELAVCPVCQHISLLRTDWHEHLGPGRVRAQIVYPIDEPVDPSLPASVDRTYRSALNVQGIDDNAFGLLVAHVMVKASHERGILGSSWHECLQMLAENGAIPHELARIGQLFVDAKRDRTRSRTEEFDQGEAEALHAICRAVLTYLYTAPKQIEQASLTVRNLDQSIEK